MNAMPNDQLEPWTVSVDPRQCFAWMLVGLRSVPRKVQWWCSVRGTFSFGRDATETFLDIDALAICSVSRKAEIWDAG